MADVTSDNGQGVHELAHERVELLFFAILDGKTRPDMWAQMADWDASERTKRRYINHAYQMRGQHAMKHRDSYLGRNLARLDRIYEAAMKGTPRVVTKRGQDPEVVYEVELRTAISALNEQNRMIGLHEPEVIEHKVPEPWRELFDAHGIRKPGNGGGREAETPH